MGVSSDSMAAEQMDSTACSLMYSLQGVASELVISWRMVRVFARSAKRKYGKQTSRNSGWSVESNLRSQVKGVDAAGNSGTTTTMPFSI